MPEETSVPSSCGSPEEKPCSSAAAAESSPDVMEEAKKLIGTGNRHLVMGDVLSAVNVFQEACGMLAQRYGDTADECGEAAFLCGKSLLELARMESSVLGNALEGVPEESDDEDQKSSSNIESANNLDDETRDDLRRQVYEALSEEPKTHTQEEENAESASPDAHSADGVTQLNAEGGASPDAAQDDCSAEADATEADATEADATEADANEADATEADASEGEKDDGSTVEDDPQDDDEDDSDEDEAEENKEEEEVGNLQLAWEMLEVAKVIYKRKESQEDQLMAAQAYLKLGEVSAESGNYPQALEDFQECLSLQLKHLPPHSRLLAESHYHVATALCYMEQHTQALQHYSSSIRVIEQRMAVLQKDMASSSDGDKERKEVEELKLLLPDIQEKMEDARESQRMGSAASHVIQQTLGGGSSTSPFLCENGGPSSSAAPPTASMTDSTCQTSVQSKAVSNISHLVRKKRKAEEVPEQQSDAKPVKQETNLNGSEESQSQETPST